MTTTDNLIPAPVVEPAPLEPAPAPEDVRPEPRVVVDPEPTLEEKLEKAAASDPEIAIVVRLLFKIKELAPFKEVYEAEVEAIKHVLFPRPKE